jgi:preprotein translocase subunit Sec61beta
LQEEPVDLDVVMEQEMVGPVEELQDNHFYQLVVEEDLSLLKDLAETVAEEPVLLVVEQMVEEDPGLLKMYQEVLLEFLEYIMAEIVQLTPAMLVGVAVAVAILVVAVVAVTPVDLVAVAVLDTSIRHIVLQELYMEEVEPPQEIHQTHKEAPQEILQLVAE